MANHRAWRIRSVSGTTFVAYSEIELRTSIGGSDTTGVTGSAICDSFFSGLPASNAYDNTTTTLWACNGTGNGCWVGWDYGATSGDWKDIVQVLLTLRNDGSWTQNSSTFAVDWSDDWNGTTGTWTEAWQQTTAWTGAGQSAAFSAPTPPSGLDTSKVEDVAWLEALDGLTASKVEADPWLDVPDGLAFGKTEAVAWLDRDQRRRPLILP